MPEYVNDGLVEVVNFRASFLVRRLVGGPPISDDATGVDEKAGLSRLWSGVQRSVGHAVGLGYRLVPVRTERVGYVEVVGELSVRLRPSVIDADNLNSVVGSEPIVLGQRVALCERLQLEVGRLEDE